MARYCICRENGCSKLEEIGEGGAQADLSVNDETNPAYVKNRTHWIENVETVLFNGEATESGLDMYGHAYVEEEFNPIVADDLGDVNAKYRITLIGTIDNTLLDGNVSKKEVNVTIYGEELGYRTGLKASIPIDGVDSEWEIRILYTENSYQSGIYVYFLYSDNFDFVGTAVLTKITPVYHPLQKEYIPTSYSEIPTYDIADLTDEVKYALLLNRTPHILNMGITQIEREFDGASIGTIGGYEEKKFITNYKEFTTHDECSDVIDVYNGYAYAVGDSIDSEGFVWTVSLTEEQRTELEEKWGVDLSY